mgnify:CR=1 FL=1|jgi:hypothetical protein
MSNIQFQPNQEIKLSGRHGVIRHTQDNTVFVEFGKNHFKLFEYQFLIDAANDHLLTFIDKSVDVRCIVSLTDKQKKEAGRRLAYCEAFDSLTKYSAGDEAENTLNETYKDIKTMHTKKPSLKTVGKWLRNWRSHGKDINLQVVTSKAGGHRLSFEMEDLLKSTINKHYLKTSRPTKANAYIELKKAYRKKIKQFIDQELPCLRTFERYIELYIPRYEVDLKRFGKRHANMENRVAAELYNVLYPLERVEMDGAEFNIGLLNDDGSFAGKVTIFGIIDLFTRCLIGYTVQVGSVKESAAAVIHTLSHSMRSKKDPEKYPMSGMAYNYIFDNGPGFQAKMTRNFLNNIEAEYTYCRSRRATEKPFIERFWGTARTKFFSKCSGYLGKRKYEVIPEKTIKQAAKLTVSQFMVMWDDYIQNVYHHTPHSQINNWTPFEMWKEHAEPDVIMTMSDYDERLKFRGISKPLTCYINDGVRHLGQRFHSEELAALVRKEVKNTGKKQLKLDILIDHHDASAVTVLDSSGGMINVPNVNKTIARDTSFAELKALVKQRKPEDYPESISEIKAKNIVKKHRKNGTVVPQDTLITQEYITNDEPEDKVNINTPTESTTRGHEHDTAGFSDGFEDE